MQYCVVLFLCPCFPGGSGCSGCWGYALPFYLFSDPFLVCCPLCSGCCAYAGAFYRCLGETTQRVLSYSTYLTVWVTHDPSTGVRATTSLRGERAHQRCLFSPLPTVFSRALFSTTHPTLVENGRAEPFPRFHEINFIPLRFVQHRGNVPL